jgi:hypothetical protein
MTKSLDLNAAWAFVAAVIVGAVAALAWFNRNGAQAPLPFRTRSCQGAAWRRGFPTVPEQEFCTFLSVFVDAFALRESEKLKFNPDDQILAIYNALYPRKWM